MLAPSPKELASRGRNIHPSESTDPRNQPCNTAMDGREKKKKRGRECQGKRDVSDPSCGRRNRHPCRSEMCRRERSNHAGGEDLAYLLAARTVPISELPRPNREDGQESWLGGTTDRMGTPGSRAGQEELPLPAGNRIAQRHTFKERMNSNIYSCGGHRSRS